MFKYERGAFMPKSSAYFFLCCAPSMVQLVNTSCSLMNFEWFWLFRGLSQVIQSNQPSKIQINVRFMSFWKCWNCRRNGIFAFFSFSAEKKLRPNFAFWDTFKLLRCLNSNKIKLQSSIRVICILLDLISVQLKI